VSLEFLSVAAGAGCGDAPLARSPLERDAGAAGARFEVREGWNVAVGYGGAAAEAQTCREAVAWADLSHLGKLELQVDGSERAQIAARAGCDAEIELGRASRSGGAWWCPLTDTRMLVVCESGALPGLRAGIQSAAAAASQPASVTDVTSAFGALAIVGPLARDLFARFCAIDLRPHVTPVGALRPGSVARQPGLVLRERGDRYLFLFGAAVAHYIWTVVEDAAGPLGGRPVGIDALALEEAPAGA